jgi:uncharacterized membrane protein YesL
VLVLLVIIAAALLAPFGVAFTPISDEGGPQLLFVIVAWLLPFLPTPGNVALAGVTRVAASLDAPRFALFPQTLRARWRLALRCCLVSVVVLAALVVNIVFYATMSGWLRFASILWAYGTLFWLSLHIYLVPLLVHVAEPRLFDLYRRAAFVSLGHPGFTTLLLLSLLIVGFITVVFVPAYVLIGLAFISMVQAHALREIRRRHGDLVVESDEGVSRL